MLHDKSEIKRIKISLKHARYQRNIKAGIILLVASSGALFSQSVFAVTTAGTLISLLIADRLKKSKVN